jgi:hypothetical protein
VGEPVDLSGDIAAAVNGAAGRGNPIALAYVDGEGKPSVSFRGSTQVLDRQHLALWARKRQGGLVEAIASRPDVALVYYGPGGPGARYVSIRGRAHADESFNDTVYANMIQGERDQDPERAGIAVVIEVDVAAGMASSGMFHMVRDSG